MSLESTSHTKLVPSGFATTAIAGIRNFFTLSISDHRYDIFRYTDQEFDLGYVLQGQYRLLEFDILEIVNEALGNPTGEGGLEIGVTQLVLGGFYFCS